MELPRYIEGDAAQGAKTRLLIAEYPTHNSSDMRTG
jgi:hypothetical protein